MKTIKVVTCGFVSADIFAHSMRHVYEIKSNNLNYDHYFIDGHFPIDRENNVKALKETCDKYGIKWLDPGSDLGLHGNLNYWLKEADVKDDEIFLGLDPDSWPDARGWDDALIDCLEIKNTNLAFSTLNNKINIVTQGVLFAPIQLDGLLCMIPANRPTMFNVTAWRASWIKSIGGFHQPTSHWGHLEDFLWKKLVETKHCYCITVDHKETERPEHMPKHHPLYVKYKAEQASFKTRLGLKEWLLSNSNKGV